MIKHLIYQSEEGAIVAVRDDIAFQSKLNFDFVKRKVVIMDFYVECDCKRSNLGVRGVAVISNKPYAAIRGYCPDCGKAYHETEPWTLELNQNQADEEISADDILNTNKHSGT